MFTGNGSTVSVSASSVQDVAIQGFRRGTRVGAADVNVSGTERFTLNTQSGVVYVVVLTGFGATAGDYDVAVTLQ